SSPPPSAPGNRRSRSATVPCTRRAFATRRPAAASRRSTRTARYWSPARPECSAGWSRAGWSPRTGSATCGWSAGVAWTRPAPRGGAQLRGDLVAIGASVAFAPCDLSDRDAVRTLLGGLDRPLAGIVHAAGTLDDATIPSLTPARLDTVLRAKVDAAWHLHELAAGAAPFVLFSSVSGTLGGAGQGNYAAANAFLDALAEHRRALGRPAVSLAWGLWEQDGGMTSQLGQADRARLARSGILPIGTELGLDLFDAGLRTDRAVLVPVRLGPAPLRDPAPVLRGLVRTPATRPAAAEAPAGLGARLSALTPPERAAALRELVRGHVADVLGHAAADTLDAQRGLPELGMAPLAAVD